MRELNYQELCSVIGGGISGAILNYATKLMNAIFDIGKSFGGALRRVISKNMCPL